MKGFKQPRDQLHEASHLAITLERRKWPPDSCPSHDRLLRHQKYLATAVQGQLPAFWVILREEEIESIPATLAPPSNGA